MRAIAICTASLLVLPACNVVLGFGFPAAAEYDLRVSISQPPSTTQVFAPFYVTIANDGPDDARDAVLEVELPEGSQIAPDGGCSLPRCEVFAGFVFANQSRVLGFSATPVGGTIIATVKSADDVDPSNNQAALEVPGSADLELFHLNGEVRDVIAGGVPQTYTFHLKNKGPTLARSIKVDFSTTPGLSTPTLAGNGWTCSQHTCTLDSLLPLANAGGLTLSAYTPVTAGLAQVSGTVSSLTADPVASNNTATYTQTVNTDTDLAVALQASPDPVAPGGMLAYTVTVSNLGPSVAASLIAKDTLPAGTTFVSASGSGWTCSASGQDVTCTRSMLSVGDAPSIDLVVTAPTAAGSVTNTAVVTSNSLELDSTNNSASITTAVGP
jgi:uncharacterized repeat protein (TIGR01451 family)